MKAVFRPYTGKMNNIIYYVNSCWEFVFRVASTDGQPIDLGSTFSDVQFRIFKRGLYDSPSYDYHFDEMNQPEQGSVYTPAAGRVIGYGPGDKMPKSNPVYIELEGTDFPIVI